MRIDFERTLKTHHRIFFTFLANRICDWKVTRRVQCATQHWYELVVTLTAISRDAADDVTWVHTASSAFLHSRLKLFDYLCV